MLHFTNETTDRPSLIYANKGLTYLVNYYRFGVVIPGARKPRLQNYIKSSPDSFIYIDHCRQF